MLPGLERKHYVALARLRANQEFQIFLDGLAHALQQHYRVLAATDDDSMVKQTQGRIRELESIIDTYNKAPETVEKLIK